MLEGARSVGIPTFDQLDPEQIGPVPSNAIIVNQTPQLELLQRTSVCVTHAGLNTVLESLAQGVPQVAIPITFDQPGVATRIAAKKTGVTMPFEKLTSDHLSTLLGEVLNNPVYRENARKFQVVIAKTDGLSMAADIVERSLGVIKSQPIGILTIGRELVPQLLEAGEQVCASGIKIRIDMDKVPKAGRPEIPTLLPHGRKHRRILGRLAIGFVFQKHSGFSNALATGTVADVLKPIFQT
jgi:UDP-glucoronosyl and UDP-glucosyl transferase